MTLFNLQFLFRQIKHDKYISLINLVGLTIGILSALFILEYVYYERSYDAHHANAEEVYRLAYNRYDREGKLQYATALSYFPSGAWLKDNYSEVINHSRISPKYNISVQYTHPSGDQVSFKESKSFYCTTSMFEVFTLPILQGDIKGLDKSFTVAISAKAAQKYFGNENPIGQPLTVNGKETYTVCAVYEEVPKHSIIGSDFYFSIETLYHFRPQLRNVWGYDYGTTFIQLQKGTDGAAFADKALERMIEVNYQSQLDVKGMRDSFYLQPLRAIHLNSNLEYETVRPGNKKIIDILWGFSLFLLIVAWINYVNLMTARAVDRAKEIGVRKINGASKVNVISQFVAEALWFNVLCLIITILLFLGLNPLYKSAIGIQGFQLFASTDFLLTGALVFFLGIMASCIYPALILQSYQPIAVLKGKFKHSGDGIFFRKLMITLQFVISIVLLSGTIVAHRQADFLMEKDMGVSFARTLVISSPQTGEGRGIINQKLYAMKDEVMRIPNIIDYTFTSDVPMREIDTWVDLQRKGRDKSDNNVYFQIAADDHFIDFYGINVIAGRPFFKDENQESGSLIMNRKAMERMGVTDPAEALNKKLISLRSKSEFTVVGITDDFHYMSVKNAPVPTVITLKDRLKKFLSLKTNALTDAQLKEVVETLRVLYASTFPGEPFDYYLLEDKARLDLKPDKTFSFVFGLFSILAIVIAIVGIIGLLLIMTGQRMKEIGVRKVLGSSLGDVTRLLLKEVGLQYIIAIIIAIPLAWYGFKEWFLNSYLYQIDLQLWMFLVPVIALSLVIIAVIYAVAAKAFKLDVTKVLQNE